MKSNVNIGTEILMRKTEGQVIAKSQVSSLMVYNWLTNRKTIQCQFVTDFFFMS